MIQILKGGRHELVSPDPVIPGRVILDVPDREMACVSFRKDGIQEIWLFGGRSHGEFRVRGLSGQVRVILYSGTAATIEARGRVTAINARVRGCIAVAVEALRASRVEVLDGACSITAYQQSEGTLQRASRGEFFHQSKVRALGTSHALVRGANPLARVIEQARSATVVFRQD